MLNTSFEAGGTDIRVVVIDDHELFVEGLRLLVEREPGITMVGQAMNRTEAFAAVKSKPDVILLDLALGAEISLDLVPELMQAAQGARILVLTGMPDPELHLRAVRLGTRGILLKSEASTSLFKAIRKIHGGEVWFNRSLASRAIAEAFGPAKVDPEAAKIADLTAREREVITLIAEGRRNKQIGERLFLSERTVGHYLSSIFSKLEVGDRLELLIYACQHGLARIPYPHRSGSDYSKAS